MAIEQQELVPVDRLEGTELDYWVAQLDPSCGGLRFEWRDDERAGRHWVGIGEVDGEDTVCVYGCKRDFRAEWGLQRRYKDAARHCFQPSQNWAQGGVIIEREGISVQLFWQVNGRGLIDWRACMTPKEKGEERRWSIGAKTPLIAAMREFVASKYGSYVPAHKC